MYQKSSFHPKLRKKSYNHKEEDKILFSKWQKMQLYRFNPSTSKTIFTIDTPPPYTNAIWHIGGAIHYSQIDMIARTMRMKGYEVHFPMGLDRNGLPIEIQTEKENKIKMQDTDRETFLLLCKQLLDRYGDQILDLGYRLGLSCNSFSWDEVYKTDEQQYRALTQATFIELYKNGLIYEDDRPSNWDYSLKTTVADAEIEYLEGEHTLYDIEFTVKETGDPLIISTSRPELISAIGLIIFHPDDDRYKKYEGSHATVPLWNINAPILAHPSANPNFGSGILMICSFGDTTDIRIFRELGLKPCYIINSDGTLNELAGKNYCGMSIIQARKRIIADLEAQSKIKQKKIILHRFPTNERSHAPIEFIGIPELYLKQEAYITKLREYLNFLQFFPEKTKQIWSNWLDSIAMDWPISRRRYYGTEVPLWYCKTCSKVIIPEPGPYYQPWKDPSPIKKCPSCSGTNFRGETRILDTWMDSSISAYYISKYPFNKPITSNIADKLLKRDFICDIRPQGKDIVRTWLHYSMLRGCLLFNKPMFKMAWISGHVVTESGEKMSKSKGNARNPNEIIDKYGGDALRLFGAIEASHGSDLRFSEQKLAGLSKFLNKLYNISRFISTFDKPNEFNLDMIEFTDKWILSELTKASQISMDGYNKFDFQIPAKEMYNFTWNNFASIYIELIKKRAYNRNKDFNEIESKSAIWTLYYCLEVILKLFAPIIPFITDYIYQELFKKSIHKEVFSKTPSYEDIPKNLTETISDLNSLIWKLKETNDPPKAKKDEMIALYLPNNLKSLEKDLIYYHNSKQTKKLSDKRNIYLIQDKLEVYIEI